MFNVKVSPKQLFCNAHSRLFEKLDVPPGSEVFPVRESIVVCSFNVSFDACDLFISLFSCIVCACRATVIYSAGKYIGNMIKEPN